MLFLVLSSIPIILAAHAITMADSPSTVATATLNINEKPINDSDNNYITIHMNRFFETKETTVTTIAIFVVLLIGITSIIIISIKLITQILPVNKGGAGTAARTIRLPVFNPVLRGRSEAD